jgi:hypothetical protein
MMALTWFADLLPPPCFSALNRTMKPTNRRPREAPEAEGLSRHRRSDEGGHTTLGAVELKPELDPPRRHPRQDGDGNFYAICLAAFRKNSVTESEELRLTLLAQWLQKRLAQYVPPVEPLTSLLCAWLMGRLLVLNICIHVLPLSLHFPNIRLWLSGCQPRSSYLLGVGFIQHLRKEVGFVMRMVLIILTM